MEMSRDTLIAEFKSAGIVSGVFMATGYLIGKMIVRKYHGFSMIDYHRGIGILCDYLLSEYTAKEIK